MKVTQNFSDLHLSHINSEDRSLLSSNSHRSKTGNKNSFKLLTSHVDVKCGLSDDKIEFVDDEFLLISPHANFHNYQHLPVHSNVSISISPAVSPLILTTSKSENNIFDKNLSSESPAHFNVVSLSDLSDDAPYYNNTSTTTENEHHFMNDLSKTQVLNRLPDEEINGKIVNRF